MRKSLNDDPQLEDRLGINLSFPDAYSTVKDTTNFVWIEKQVTKGHLNIIAYTLPLNIDLKKFRILKNNGLIFQSQVSYLIPIFGTVLGYIFLKELITIKVLISLIAVCIGIYFVKIADNKKN